MMTSGMYGSMFYNFKGSQLCLLYFTFDQCFLHFYYVISPLIDLLDILAR